MNLNIISAYDGEQAEQLLAEGLCPRVIFLDINMPIKNGYEFLQDNDQSLVALGVPVIVLTSSIHDQDHERMCAFESVTNYLAKPLAISTLEELSILTDV